MSKKRQRRVKEEFQKLKAFPPSRVKQTRREEGVEAARKQEIAIALDRAGVKRDRQ